MSDLLREAWLLPAALHTLGAPEYAGQAQSIQAPKLGQLIKVTRQEACVKATISDKFNYNLAIITPDCLRQFQSENPETPLESLLGGIIKLTSFYIGSPHAEHEGMLPVIIEGFSCVGSYGSPVHGDPRYLMAVPAVKHQLASKKRKEPTHPCTPEQKQDKEEEDNNDNDNNSDNDDDDGLSLEGCIIPEDQAAALRAMAASEMFHSAEYFLSQFPPRASIPYGSWHAP